ncbi:hypothetical protein D3C87_1558000 [compost metagenome]
MNQRPTQIKPRRIAQHHARQQQFFSLLSLVNTFQTGELQAVVHALNFAQTLGMNSDNLIPFVVRQGNDIGDVVFTLGIVVVQFCEPALHVRAVGDQDTGIDFLNLALFVRGIFVLNNAGHFAVFTRDAAIAGWIVEFYGQ